MSILRRRTKLQAQHFVIANFDAYQDGALTEADTAFYRQHLASCQECQEWKSRQVRLIEQLGIELSPPYRLSPAAADRIHQNLYRRMRRANLMNNIRTSVGAVAAIAIIAIVVGVFIWWQSGNIGATEQTTALEQETPVSEAVGGDALDEQLIEAVRAGDRAEVERLLMAGADPSIKDSSGAPILKSAITGARISGNEDNILLLLEHGADVNALDTQGNALLPRAARNGLLEVTQLMLEAGADVDGTLTVGDLSTAGQGSVGDATALNLAAGESHLEVVKLLIAHGADVNAPEAFYNRTALHGAAWFNHHEIVQMLIENGADLNPHSTWADGETPLHFAARNGSAEAIQVLIDADADLDVQTEVGRTPLMSVLISNPPSNLPEIVTLLLDGGANPNLQDGDGNTALHYASRRGSSLGVRVEAIAILIEHGAALDLENDEGQTAVDVAATEEMAEMLRAAGAVEQEALDLEGLNLAELDSLLLEAVRSDDLGAIEQLLDAGADSDARSSMGVPILMLAAFKNNLDMVRLLVEHGADVNVQTGSGPRFGELRGSPLTAAAKFGSPEMIELLLDAGADANASTWAESGEASEALFAAAEENHAEIIELLLAHGAVVDGTNLGGRSPLIHSAYFNSPDVIRVLLTHGADIDLQDVTGYTALHWAATDGNLEAAQVLIENGAALDIETNMGQTPLEIRTDEAIIELLRAAGAHEPLYGEWANEMIPRDGMYTYSPDGTGFFYSLPTDDEPTSEFRYTVEEKWADEEGNVYYKVLGLFDNIPYDESDADDWYATHKIHASGEVMELVYSPTKYVDFGEAGATYKILNRQ